MREQIEGLEHGSHCPAILLQFLLGRGEHPAIHGYGYRANGSITNLLVRSKEFDSASWGKGGITAAAPTVTANAGAAPDGTSTADKIDFPAVPGAGQMSVISQAALVTAAVHTMSVWLKGVVGGETLYICATPDGVTYYRQPVTLSTSWQWFVLVTGNLTATNWYFEIGVDRRDAGQAAVNSQFSIYAWGA